MPVTVNINDLSLCHKGSNGITTATIPDVCKTPAPPAPPVPIPYPNIAMSSDLLQGTTTVSADGGNMCAIDGSQFMKSTGDEAGVAGGIVSNLFIKEATWILYSFDVKFEGKAVCRLTDKMFHNHQNTVNIAGEIQALLGLDDIDDFCVLCDNCHLRANDAVEFSEVMQTEYTIAGANPDNKCGADIKASVESSLTEQGYKIKVGGTTDTKGNIKVEENPGDPCDKLFQEATKVHEQVHKDFRNSLVAQHGEDTPAFNAAWDEPQGWVQDELNAHAADQKFLKQFMKECNKKCP
jgi:hypothetical protein